MAKMCEKDLILRPNLDEKQHLEIHFLCALIGSGLGVYNCQVQAVKLLS